MPFAFKAHTIYNSREFTVLIFGGIRKLMSAPVVVSGAMSACSMGAAPASLMFLPSPMVSGGTQMGTIANMTPFLNILPFGVCSSLANPAVAGATAAAMGALTPMPCTPMPAGPWSPGSATAVLAGIPLLTAPCLLNCSFAGAVTISFAAQVACSS